MFQEKKKKSKVQISKHIRACERTSRVQEKTWINKPVIRRLYASKRKKKFTILVLIFEN